MSVAEPRVLRQIVVGAICTLVSLITLTLILELYVRRSPMCLASEGCHRVAMIGAATGLIGIILLFHAVATPSRR